jgi:TonB family protein
MIRDRIFIYSLITSFFLHGLAILFLPGFNQIIATSPAKFIEVDVMPPVDIEPAHPPSDEDRSVESESATSSAVSDEANELIASLPMPDLRIPSRIETVDEQPALDFAQSTYSTDRTNSVNTEIAPDIISEVTAKAATSIIDSSIQTPPDMNWRPSQSHISPGDKSSSAKTQDLPIEGPVAKRKMAYRPPLPEPVASMGGLIKLKFWVLPDGSIGRIVPLVRSDPALEKAAIEFLEKWRFEPVAKGSPEQWGILPIRFKIH